MSRLPPPRSFTGPVFKRMRARKYPWVFESKKLALTPRMECEACFRQATHLVHYEERALSELMVLCLCGEHVLFTRGLDKWKDLFKLIDKKIDRRSK